VATAQLTIHASTLDYTILSWGRCLCLIGHTQLGAPAWQAATRVAETLAAEFPKAVLALTVVEDLTAATDPVQRAAAEDYARKVAPLLAKSAVVIESEGFGSALVRSVITGMAVLARSSKYPRRVFGSVQEAAYWLSDGSEQATNTPAFLAWFEQLRLHLPRRHVLA
jgi:hypothetical protein